MKNKLVKLVDVKSIMTLLLTVTFIVLSIRKDLSTEMFYDLFKMIVVFYFGTQSVKPKE